MNSPLIKATLVVLSSLLICGTGLAQRQMERLGRGVTALKSSSTQVYVGWRLLGNDPSDIAFNLYRSANGAAAVKVNATPLTATTDYVDTPGSLSTTAYTYSVKPVMAGVEVADTWANPLSGGFTLPANAPSRQYVPVPMQPTPDDTSTVSYGVKFCWVGDFDGDGEFDFLIDRTNPEVEAKQWLQAYKRDGTLLWQMDMGPNSVNHYNITPGSSAISIGHGDNVTVYDLDGDGKAEVIVRTANGVVFPNGTTLAAPNNEVQYISIIDGLTGLEKARATVPIPASWVTKTHVQGQMGIVYADGVRPSLFFHPSNRNPDESFNKCAITWDYRNGQITQRWIWLESGHTAEGHQVRFADVDNDGKDEFVDIGNIVKSDGSGQINGNVLTEVVHGDRFHVTDIDPDRPGQETFLIQQNNGTGLATVYSAADKSSVIKKWYAGGVVDVGRGVVGDFVPTVKGCEFFSTMPGVFDAKTNQLFSSGPFPPETIWWDGDLGREFLSTIGSSATSPGIDKFNTATGGTGRVLSLYSDPSAPNSPYNNYIAYGGRPQFWGDILGDWREELLCVATDNSELRIYTTKNPDGAKSSGGAPFRIYTLMHNPQYRIQATAKGYVQSSYVDYYLGNDMTPPPPPPMVDAKLVWRGGSGSTTWDTTTQSWLNNGANSTFADGDSVRFDISGNSATTVTLSGTLQPSAVTVYSPSNQAFDGTGGTLAGPMTMMKSGAGSMVLSGVHTFTGKTTIWDGALSLSGTLQSSQVTVWGGTFGGAPAGGLAGGRIAGTGNFSQPVSLKYRGAITPGTGMGNAGTLTLGGLTAEDGSYLAFDLSNDSSGTVTANDRVAINGNLSVSGTVGIVVKALNGQLAPGTYTLATYTGTLTGSASNFAVTVPPGTPYSLSVGSGAVKLIIPVTRSAGSITWRGSGAAWDLATSQNWLAGGSPGIFVAGDTVAFDATGAASPAVTLSGVLPVAGITVNSAGNYSFAGSGSISGSGGITKSGSGTLTISTNNDYTGPTVINGGILAVNSLGDAGAPSAIGAAAASAANLVINGGTLQLTGSQSNTNRNLSLGASGGILDVATAGSSMQISGVTSGSGKLTKAGPGTLILASANSYTGGTVINSGTIYLAGATANSSALGSGAVTINNGTLTMADVQASETAAWNLIVPDGATARVNADGRCQLSGSLTGAGDFTFYTPYVRTEMDGNWSGFAGRIFVISDADGGNFRIRNSAGYPSAALDLGDDVYAFYNQSPGSSLTIQVGTLSGATTAVLAGCNSASRTITWQVGGRNEDSTFAGIIANATGPTALAKTGTGILTLTGACTHTGATTVQQGTLRITGSSTGSTVTVQSGATLGGSGVINGNVSVQGGGVIEHGTTPLAITGNLTIIGQTLFRPDPAAVLGAGTLTVLTYTGSIVGSPSFAWLQPVGSLLVGTFNVVAPVGAVPGRVELVLTPGGREPGPIVWAGSTSFDWDTTTSNWLSGGAVTSYQAGDSPAFTDAGIATSLINLVGNVEPSSVAVDASKNYTFGGAGIITGTASLTKSGSGTLSISAAHSYTGGTYLNGGTLNATTDAATAGIGAGPVVFQGGILQQFDGSGSYSSANYAMQVAAGQSGTLRCDSRMDLSGPLIGSGVFNIYVPYIRFKQLGDWSAFSGQINVTTDADGGFLRLSNAAGLPDASVALANKATLLSYLNYTHTMPVGSLSGTATSTLSGSVPDNNNPPAGTVVTWQIGAKNVDSTFSGNIQNGNGTSQTAIQKTGTANLVLDGTSTYTGPTAINNGKLTVNGTLANTATLVAPTATLAGSGTIGGAVTCNGTLAPGNPIGTLTLSSGLTLASTSTLEYDLGTTSDRTSVTGNLTLDGTLNVTATAGFAAGTYTLIAYTGTLANNTLVIGSLPANFTGSINTSTAGQVRLVITQVMTAYEQWQVANFSSISNAIAQPPADPDGDGTSNEVEFRLGLDPTNGSSSFKAVGAMAPGGFTLTWPSAPGLVFEIQRSATLDGSWEMRDTVTGIGTWTDIAPPSDHAFYRVSLVP